MQENFSLICVFSSILGIVLSYLSTKVERNEHLGAKFPATLADPDVWKATNKKMAHFSYIVLLIFGFVNLIFYLSNIAKVYSLYSFAFLSITFMVGTVYMYFYSESLLKKKKMQKSQELSIDDPKKCSSLNTFLRKVKKRKESK